MMLLKECEQSLACSDSCPRSLVCHTFVKGFIEVRNLTTNDQLDHRYPEGLAFIP